MGNSGLQRLNTTEFNIINDHAGAYKPYPGWGSASQEASSQFPRLIFGTSALGASEKSISSETKRELVRQIVTHNPELAVFDCSTKDGNGNALKNLGQYLYDLQIPQERVLISNKLGWKCAVGSEKNSNGDSESYRVALDIGYESTFESFEQDNKLLDCYPAQVVSVHDPDQFIDEATTSGDRVRRKCNVLDAYRALDELKSKGEVLSIGIGAADIDVIDFVSDHTQLDWAMFANSLTPFSHRRKVRRVLDKLQSQGVKLINSAVFNSGFLVGGEVLNCTRVTPQSHPDAFTWREKFTRLCINYGLSPALVCVQFSFVFSGLTSVALDTSSPDRIARNMQLVKGEVPMDFWHAMRDEGLIDINPER